MNNPYYSDKPFLTTYPTKIVAIVTIIIGGLTIICALLKPAQKFALIWRRFIIFHVILLIVGEISMAFLSFPLMLLPYNAIHFIGLLTNCGISQLFQICLFYTIIIANCGLLCPLFYLRMVYLLQRDSHFLKSNSMVAVALFIYYILPCFIVYPLFYFATGDPEPVKWLSYLKYNVTYPNLFDKEVFFFPASYNHTGTLTCFIFGVILLHFCTVAISGVITLRIILEHQKVHQSTTSFVTVKKQLVILVVVFIYFATTELPLFFSPFLFGPRADLFVLGIFNLMITVPAVLLAITFTFKPLRMGLDSLIIRRKRKENDNFTNFRVVSTSGSHITQKSRETGHIE